MPDNPKPTETQASAHKTLAHELCRISGYAYAEEIYYGRADQIISALGEAGYVIVPRQPSEKMRRAGAPTDEFLTKTVMPATNRAVAAGVDFGDIQAEADRTYGQWLIDNAGK